MSKHYNRREFLKLAGVTGASLSMVSLGFPLIKAAAAQESVSARGFIEPPIFVDRVASGALPPIDERLPKDVFVVGPDILIQEEYMTWENGQYGGEIRNAHTFATAWIALGGGATILRSPSQSTEASRPNVMSAFSYSDDYTTFRFTIRDGLKWSDGVPVTTEDIRFTIEDIYSNPEVQRPFPTELYAQGNSLFGPAELNIIDELNFELIFSRSYGYFVAALNSWIPYYDFLIKPAHYLKQFHADYADEADLAALLAENNQTSWVQLMNSKDVAHWSIGEASALGQPVLNAWVLTEVNGERRVFERNPYYWHVDSNGRQLPYIDRVINDISVDDDAQTNAILAGQVSLASGNQLTLNNMPVYQQSAERAGYRVFTTGSFNWPILLYLNHDYQYDVENSPWQQLIADPDRRFGRAIASAIDPEDINDSVFFGLFGEPFLNSGNHDPALANQLLDELGMVRPDDGGFRLGPDGQPFVFRLTHTAMSPDFDPVAELLKEQIEAVGIRVDIERIEEALFNQRLQANEVMASMFWNDGNGWGSGISEDYLPAAKGGWSPLTWLSFVTQGQEGRTPPTYIQEFYDLHTARKEFPPQSPEGQEVFAQMMQWFEENYVFIPTTGLKITPNIVDVRLRNVQNEGAPFELDTYINAEGVWFAE